MFTKVQKVDSVADEALERVVTSNEAIREATARRQREAAKRAPAQRRASSWAVPRNNRSHA